VKKSVKAMSWAAAVAAAGSLSLVLVGAAPASSAPRTGAARAPGAGRAPALAQGAGPAPTSSGAYMQAAILPVSTFALGGSLSSGPDGRTYGYSLMADGIENSWDLCSTSCTIDFAVFLLSNEAATATVQFKVVNPSGATVYQYSWPSDKISAGGNPFSVYANGTYNTAGTYYAELMVGGQMEGWAPVVFSAASGGRARPGH
jgi:hypothetical protein